LSGNVFAAARGFGFGKLAMPPGTTLSIDPPHQDPQQGETSEIRFKNRFTDFRIGITESMRSVGLGGYTYLGDGSQEEAQARYWHAGYVVRIDATFSSLLRGHPDMPLYREWVTGIVEGLAREFDEEAIWRRTVESVALCHYATGSARIPNSEPGAMRYAAPPSPQPPK
jgi:hypothetical protein